MGSILGQVPEFIVNFIVLNSSNEKGRFSQTKCPLHTEPGGSCSHCTGPGTGMGPGPGTGTMDLYIMLCTVHTTPRPGTGQGAGTGTDGFHTHF